MVSTAKTLNQPKKLINNNSLVKKDRKLVASWKKVNGKLVCQWFVA